MVIKRCFLGAFLCLGCFFTSANYFSEEGEGVELVRSASNSNLPMYQTFSEAASPDDDIEAQRPDEVNRSCTSEVCCTICVWSARIFPLVLSVGLASYYWATH